MSEINLDQISSLFSRFQVIYGQKFYKDYTPEQITLWHTEWREGLVGFTFEAIKSALVHCRQNVEWPPSLPEFIRYCESSLCLPTPDQVIQYAIRRDLSHPITKMVYDKVGSWALSHDSEKDLVKKVKIAHQEALAAYRKEQFGMAKLGFDRNKVQQLQRNAI